MQNQWYLIKVKRNQTDRALLNLTQMDCKCYRTLLFSKYLFVCIEEDSLLFSSARFARGVDDFFRIQNNPVPIHKEVIDGLISLGLLIDSEKSLTQFNEPDNNICSHLLSISGFDNEDKRVIEFFKLAFK
ncbi:hypothetical protein D5018_07000 [Parashewanella curva]|uniref:NusG-like N-terminal domain-containing protein n=1 Tax=Parashewanella curva TaxID=2338552 RepID=A0A3L8Q0Q9_9GAMM|nr:hypothetical protein [Parashewanella curva]RLV60398.1 hypothetical protein D5018_07000 [Parashewanella curva]